MNEATAEPKKQKRRRDINPTNMTFMEHLDELRTRLVSSLKVSFVAIVVCGFFAWPITNFFLGFVPDSPTHLIRMPLPPDAEEGAEPDEKWMHEQEYREFLDQGGKAEIVNVRDRRPVALAPAENFVAMVKCVVLVAIVLASPWILLQFWFFVAPGLYSHEKRYAVPFVAAGTFFFAAGLTFAYFVGLPLATNVLYNYDLNGSTVVQWRVQDTLSFVLRMFLAFGIAFEMPVVVFLLAVLGVVTPRTLSRKRPYVVVAIFIAAAVLTPPDIVSQMILAGPLWLLFEVSIIAARIFVKRHEQEQPA